MASPKVDGNRPECTASGFKVRLDRLYAAGHRPLAVFSADNGQFAVHGIQVLDSKKGPFVQMPQTNYKANGQTIYKDIFHAITAGARQDLYSAVMEQYEQARAQEAVKDAEEPDAKEIPGQGPSM